MRALADVIATLWLPAGGTVSSVRPAGGELLLSGYAQTGPGCIRATADAVRMRVLRTHLGPCDDLAKVTGVLTPAVVYDPKSPWQEVVLSNGRVVFRYEDASDMRPEWTYGAPGARTAVVVHRGGRGALWLVAHGSASRVANVASGSCDPLGAEPNALLWDDGALFFLDPPRLHGVRP